MEREVMDIVKDKEYIELTAAERAELGELCSSEDEYNQVKSMFAGISAMDWSNPAPKVETKEKLDHLFAQKYPKVAPVWYNAPLAVIAPKGKPFYRQPLVQAAAVGLLIFLAYPFVNSSVMEAKTNQVALLENEKMEEQSQESDKDHETVNVVDAKDVIDANDKDEAVIDTKNQFVQDLPKSIVDDVPMPIASVSAAPITKDLSATRAISPRDSGLEDASFGGAAQPGSTHPDGIFIGDKAEIFSIPASHEPAVFDLLTSTF